MLRLYMLGGEDIERGGPRGLREQAIRDAGAAPSVAVFPWGSKGREEKQRRLLVTSLKEMGARTVRFVEHSLPYIEMVAIAEGSDIIYLPDGDPRLLTEMLRDTGSNHLLRLHDNVIIGDSAGALALGNEYVVSAKNGTDRMSVENGLAVSDFAVSVHYQSAQDPQLENLSKERSIFAIPDGAAVRSDRCSLVLLGDVELFMDGRKL